MITDDEAGFDEFVAGRSAALARTAYLLTSDHHLRRGRLPMILGALLALLAGLAYIRLLRKRA